MGNILGSGHEHLEHQDPGQHQRGEANRLYQLRNDCYQKSQNAYKAGDHAGAKAYSQQAKAYDAQAKQANRQASDDIFAAKNNNRMDGMVDLHGLYVDEAVAIAERQIVSAKKDGKKSVVFIVGRGLHSADGVAKIAPAVEKLVDKHNLRCTPNSPHPGCLTVELVAREERGWLGGLPLPRCVIM